MANRILFVTNYRGAWGHSRAAGIFVEREAEALSAAGVDVRFFDLGRSHSPLVLAKRWFELRSEIRRIRPDLIHAQYGTIVALVSALTFHPFVVTFGGSDLLVGASVSRFRAWLGIAMSHFAALFAKRIICVSEQLRLALWWRRATAVVIPRGVDLSLFTPGPQVDARVILGWDMNARVVIIDAARDPVNKGLSLAQRAVLIARERIPDLQLVVLRDVAPDEMRLRFRAADALICCSRQEGSPNVVKEALACALPVIGVDVGDVRERLAGVTPSFVVDRTPEAIAAAIISVVQTPQRSNGREAVLPLALNVVASRIAAVYQSILGTSPAAQVESPVPRRAQPDVVCRRP